MSLHLTDVTVERAGRPVVGGVSLTAAPGDIVLLRGGNGSGKTSILRAVAELASYEGQVVFKRGVQPLDPAFIRSFETHYVSPEGGLNPRLTVRETAGFEAAMEGRDPAEALEMLALDRAAELRVAELSTGQRRRLSFLRLLLGPRALWLLDEPFSGLDTEGRAVVLALIENQRERGGIVLLALHEEVIISGARTLRVEAAA
ncbi:heme ABC exporter ATP-binding protein CcmA [Parvularcula maris]|nr:heme ABC exporter ATP-binding protein CcmA [Parvularcula maris]